MKLPHLAERRFSLLAIVGAALVAALWPASWLAAQRAEQESLAAPPSQAQQDQALELIREVYGERFKTAKSPDERSTIAVELLSMARKTEDDLSVRFVALDVCRKIAVSATDMETAFQAIAETAEKFDIDRFALAAEAAEVVLPKLKRTAEFRQFLYDVWTVVEDAVDEEQFEAVTRLGETAVKAASRSGVRDLEPRVSGQLAEIESQRKLFLTVRESRATLQVDPTNSAANQAVGEYVCFCQDNWDEGISMLALVADQPYRQAALLELDRPNDWDSYSAAGDAWWESADKRSDEHAAAAMRRRAAHWYQMAMRTTPSSVNSYLQRQVLQKRIDAAGATGALSEELAQLVSEDQRPAVARSSTTKKSDEDGCSRCRGTGIIDCSIRGCSRGRVKVYQNQVVGRNPASGQALVQRVAVRVPCQECYGKGNQKCPDCRGTGK